MVATLLALASPLQAQSWNTTMPDPAAALPPGHAGYVVPGAPMAPAAAARPLAWPGEDAGEAYIESDEALPEASASPSVVPPGGGYAAPATYPATMSPYTPWPQPAAPAGSAPPAAAPSAAPIAPASPASAWPAPMARPATPPAERWPIAGAADYPMGQMQACESAQELARIGSEVVLASEILPSVNEVLLRHKDQLPRDQYELQRTMLIRARLQSLIDTKLVYLDAKTTIPEENFPSVEEQLGKHFEDKELPQMMKRAHVASRPELEARLAEMGTSISREKRIFMERALAHEWLRQNAKSKKEPSREQLLQWYRSHLDQYTHEAKARWEQITVNLSSQLSREQAYQTMTTVSNMLASGAPFAQVARQYSQGTTAQSGGQRDWTTRGSLVSTKLDEALFTLPVGQISPILEDSRALHIIRVVERQDAGVTPFEQTQAEIREKLKDEWSEAARAEYVEKLRARFPVWTVFDGQPLPPQMSSAPPAPRR